MGLFDNIAKRLGSLRSKGYESGNLGSFFGGNGSSGRDMLLNKGWVYAAVHAISEAMANTDFVLYVRDAKGNVSELDEHPLLDLLDGVNPTMTGYELKHRTGSHLELSGNAYWLLMNAKGKPVSNDTEEPAAIYPLNPAKVRVERGTFPELVKFYRFAESAGDQVFQPYQILHLKYPNPSDDVMGLAPVEALRSWVETEQNASDWQRVLFTNGARVGGILKSSKTLSKEQIELLRAQWHETQQGLRNAHKPVIMPDFLTYEDTSKTSQEMDFVNSLNELRDKILSGLRVPKTILGNAEGSTNRATAETATYVFALYTIKPKMKLITAYLNEFLVPRFGDNLYLGFKDPVPENRDLEMVELTNSMGGQAIQTINEARERYLGLERIDGGDVILAPVMDQEIAREKPSASPVEEALRVTRSSKAATSGKPFRTQSARNAEKRRTFSKTVATLALAEVTKALETKTKSVSDLTDEEYSKVWKAGIARTAPFEKKMIEALKKVNAKALAEAKKNLANAIKSKAVDPNDLIKDKNKYVQLVIDAVVPIQSALFDQEGKAAAELIGVDDIEMLTPAAKKAIEKSVGLMANSYTDTTLDLLKTKLTEGVEEGYGLAELTDILEATFEYSDGPRAEATARTETTRMANDAKVAAWEESGIVKSKTWYTAEDERVCPYCDAMNGTTIDLSDNFFNEGDSLEGSDGTTIDVDYSDMGGPPAHVNCRCDLRPDGINESPDN